MQFLSGNLFAQKYHRHELIGAYVYNLTKKILWENEENISEFHFLVLSSDQKIIGEFRQLANTLTLRNKPIKVTASKSLPISDQFHLIFLGKEKEELLPGVFDNIEGENILLISDGFLDKRLIMINFIEKEDKKIQFEINKANIINQNLTILPDIVLLGGTEIDLAKLYRESQVSLRSMQNEIEKLGNDLNDLLNLIDSLNMEITQQQEIINKQTEEFSGQQEQLIDQKAELQRLFQSVKSQQDTLENQEVILKQRERELSKKSGQIQKSNEVLASQRLTISEHAARIKTQQKTLKEQGVVISTQRDMITMLGVLTVLIFILIIIIFWGYKNKQKVNKFLEAEITVRKRTEAALTFRTGELARSNNELEAFSYSVSHDLRAPLRHIHGFMDLLQRKEASSLDEKSRHYMATISDSAKKMGALIDELLSFSRLGRQAMTFKKIDLNKMVRNVVEEMNLDTGGPETHWRIGELPTVRGDEPLLRIVLTNLLSNAKKFSSTREQPKIEVGCHFNKKENTPFVRDNGVGYDMQYADKLFGVFQRLHSQNEFEGTGVGLAIAQRIIHRHGGRIWAESELGKGATFYFSLPLENEGGRQWKY